MAPYFFILTIFLIKSVKRFFLLINPLDFNSGSFMSFHPSFSHVNGCLLYSAEPKIGYVCDTAGIRTNSACLCLSMQVGGGEKVFPLKKGGLMGLLKPN